MTYKQATASHIAALAALGWATSPALKVPHATSPCGSVRLFFKAQAVYAASGRAALGQARSLHVDSRTVDTEDLVSEGRALATFLASAY